MKNHKLLFACVTLLGLSHVSGISAHADQDLILSQLNSAYLVYQDNPAQSCQDVKNISEKHDLASLDILDQKKALYFLGNCHYQLNKLDDAVFYYNKITKIFPDDHQPLIDAGTVFLQQGQYSLAEKKYQQALTIVRGNDALEDNVRSLIENIPGKLKKEISVTTGIGYDSNVNSGPQDDIHLIYKTFNYTLNNDDKPRDDYYHYQYLSLALSKAVNSETVYLFDVSGSYSGYFNENEFNTAVFGTSFGFKKVFGTKSLTVKPYVNMQTFDNARYQISSGLNLTGAARVNEKINTWPYLGWYSQNFYNDKLRDAYGITAGNTISYQLSSAISLIGSLFLTNNSAVNNQYSYNNVFLGTSFNYSWNEYLKTA
ncbi:MAG: tetratricopeptide repeat protein, partial [Candidatus Omnitrophica bacterium]|nr:tetratricopeptide repeat protein [Candidatus Omnitrophota bacterium]